MQQGRDLVALFIGQARLAQQLRLERQVVFGDALYAAHGQPAIAGNIGGLGCPGRHGAKTRRHYKNRADNGTCSRRGRRFAIVQQGGQPGLLGLSGKRIGRHQVDKTGLDAADLVVNGLQAGKELLDAKIAQGIDARRHALKSRQVQGHGSGGLDVVAGSGSCPAGLAHPVQVRVNPEFYQP